MASEEAPVVQSTASSLWSSVASSLGGAFGTQAKDLLYAGIKQKYNEHSSALKEQFESNWGFINDKVKEGIEAKIEDLLESSVKPWLEKAVLDPNMPAALRSAGQDALEDVWPDIKEELWHLYENSVFEYEDLSETGKAEHDRAGLKARARAFMLYAVYPFDRGFWANTRNPWWLFFKVIKLLPFYNISSWAFFVTFLLLDKQDEYQLIAFILEFKGAQFISMGVLPIFIGYLKYYYCVNLQLLSLVDDTASGGPQFLHVCSTHGPGVEFHFWGEVVGFALRIALVWVAFALLPLSVKKGIRKLKAGQRLSPYMRHLLKKKSKERKEERARAKKEGKKPAEMQTEAEFLQSSVAYDTLEAHRSGGHSRLRALLKYDLAVFTAMGVLWVLLGAARMLRIRQAGIDADLWAWQTKSDFFLIKTLYGVLGVPFAVFLVPIFAQILAHVKPTAYNRYGACVPKKKKEQPRSEQNDQADSEEEGRRVNDVKKGEESKVEAFDEDAAVELVKNGLAQAADMLSGTTSADDATGSVEAPLASPAKPKHEKQSSVTQATADDGLEGLEGAAEELMREEQHRRDQPIEQEQVEPEDDVVDGVLLEESAQPDPQTKKNN